MQALCHGGAVAYPGRKGASGKKYPGIKTPQEKLVLTDGKDREKVSSSPDCAPERVVVENNNLGAIVQGGKLAVQGCAEVAACRNALVEKGLGALLGVATAQTALDALSDSEKQYVLTVATSGRADLIEKLTPEQRAAYDYMVEQDRKGIFSVLPDQPDLGDNSSSKPNVGKELDSDKKKELAGAGSSNTTPPENDPEKRDEKPSQKLNQKQESAIRKIDNTIKNALKDHDITGTLKDMDNNPVPRENGGYWDHMQEMQNTLRGLRNHADTLKNVDNPEAQAAYGRATDAIKKIESALKGHGI